MLSSESKESFEDGTYGLILGSQNPLPEDENTQGSLALANELLEDVKKNMITHALESSILILREFLNEDDQHADMQDAIRRYLIMALGTRFALYGWVEDMEEWLKHVAKLSPEAYAQLRRQQWSGQDVYHDNGNIRLAADLIKECRLSIDVQKLNTAICIAEEALKECGEGELMKQVEFHMHLGNALVMRYLFYESMESLSAALRYFRRVGGVCEARPLRYTCFIALAHIGLLKVTEGGDFGGLWEMLSHMKSAMEEDREGRNAFNIGTELLKANELQEAVRFLSVSLLHRVSPHPRRDEPLQNLGCARLTQFEQFGEIHNLEEAILLHRESLMLMPPPHPLRSASLNNLAGSFWTQFKQKGDIQDLEESILLFRESLLLTPPPHPNRSMLLNNLAGAVQTRFGQKGDIQDLEEAILLHRESFMLRPPPHPLRSTSPNNLANAVRTRFAQKGDIQDLEESIQLHRESLMLRPPPHPGRSTSLNNLAGAVQTRFEQKGDIQDLEESIQLHRESLMLRPPPHPDRSASLNNLAGAIETRFEQKGDIQDLEESIQLHRESLMLMPPPHPGRSTSLNNLAGAVQTRFEQKGDIQDLEEAILLHRDSLKLRPPPHPLRSRSLNNLANSVRARFKQKGDIQDLEESILLHRESLMLTPPPHPDRSMSLNNLANAVITRFDVSGSSDDLNTAFNYYSDASQYDPGSLFDRLVISKFWARHARKHSHSSVLDAYQCAIAILPRLASLDLTLRQRQSVLTHAGQITSDAAQCAIDQNSLHTAVVFLSTGRSVFWSQGLHLRTPLERLAEKEPELAEHIRSVSQRLENAAYEPRDSNRTPDVSTSDVTRMSHLVKVRNEALEKVRQLEGFEDFLLPPSFVSIQKAARRGTIIMLNASQYGCDALILNHPDVPVERVHLPEINLSLLRALKVTIQLLQRGGSIEARAIDAVERKVRQDTADMGLPGIQPESDSFVNDGCFQSIKRHQGVGSARRRMITNQNAFKFILGKLWITIVEPVIRTLQLEKTTSPTRIWWCPTGPFAFLPIHAAGIYSDGETSGICLSDYAISSYCSSPQDLIVTEDMEMPSSFKLFAVVEPDAIDGNIPLPCTLTELEKISQHLPSQEVLIPYESSKKSPTPLDAVLTNIHQSTCVHFGCHGHQHLTNPLKSSLTLSGGSLTMERIIRECQTSRPSLAYLSACETAKGDEARPDESLNLVATMMFAGFKSVVGTMWSIQDRDGPVVADKFYAHLFRHKEERAANIRDAAEGLHLAVKELRLRGRPFRDWVPFVHYGI